MKIKKILKEEGGKPYTVDHTFNITQGENKISTHVKVSVSSPDPGQSKKIADSQMRKVMSYMRSQDEGDDENEEQFSSGSMTRPMNAEPVDTLPAQDYEEQEEENPQSSARDFWKSKGFGESKPLSSLKPEDVDRLVGEAVRGVRSEYNIISGTSTPTRPSTQRDRDTLARDLRKNRDTTRRNLTQSEYRKGSVSATQFTKDRGGVPSAYARNESVEKLDSNGKQWAESLSPKELDAMVERAFKEIIEKKGE